MMPLNSDSIKGNAAWLNCSAVLMGLEDRSSGLGCLALELSAVDVLTAFLICLELGDGEADVLVQVIFCRIPN